MTTNNKQNSIELLFNAYHYQYQVLALNGPVGFDAKAVQDTMLSKMVPMTFQEISVGEQWVQAKVLTGDMVVIELAKLILEVVTSSKFFFDNAISELTKMNIHITPEQLCGMTFGQAIKFSEGKEADQVFKQRGIVAGTYHAVDGALGKTVDVAVDATRVGMSWLGKKLQQWADKK